MIYWIAEHLKFRSLSYFEVLEAFKNIFLLDGAPYFCLYALPVFQTMKLMSSFQAGAHLNFYVDPMSSHKNHLKHISAIRTAFTWACVSVDLSEDTTRYPKMTRLHGIPSYRNSVRGAITFFSLSLTSKVVPRNHAPRGEMV